MLSLIVRRPLGYRPQFSLRRGFSTPPSLSPVPIGPGEMLLYTSGSSTRSTVTRSWIGTLATVPYLIVTKTVEFFTPDLPPLLNSTWTTLFGALALGSTMIALSTTRACMRAAVLTADGQNLRLYPYGSVVGWGTGSPVTVPIKLLQENVAFALAKRDPHAIFVQVRSAGPNSPWSKAHLVFDLPPPSVLAREEGVTGSGLTFTSRGLTAASQDRSFGAAAASSLAGFTPSDRAAQQTFALLAWVLQGNTVGDMERARGGNWTFDKMGVQLGEGVCAGGTGAACLWKAARDKAGREYFYNPLTWESSWEPPPGYKATV